MTTGRRGQALFSFAVAMLAIAVWIGPYMALGTGGAQIEDIPHYKAYADTIDAGGLPYRDFALEYPPLSLAPMLAAEIGGGSELAYATRYRVEEGFLAAALAAVSVLAAFAAGFGHRRALVVGTIVALAPLAIGPVLLSRFDLWPSLLAGVAIWLALVRRDTAAGVFAGLGAAAKLWPVLLVPLLIALAWRRGGRRQALSAAAGALAGTLLGFLPGLLASPVGVWDSISGQAGRALQVESLGASLLGALDAAGLGTYQVFQGPGSQDVAGAAADRLATISSLAQAAAVAAALVFGVRALLRSRREGLALVVSTAAVTLGFIAFGRVLSPQYMAWVLMPSALLVCWWPQRRAVIAGALVLAACALTGAYFPDRYFDYALGWQAGPVAIVVCRNLALVAAYIVALWAAVRLAALRDEPPKG